MVIFYPPYLPGKTDRVRIFLAGTIDMGNSVDWQNATAYELHDFNVEILNPRRPDYDNEQPQVIENEYFNKQVNWELDGIASSDFVFFNFAENSLSPISLMELGTCINRPESIIVTCHPNFWRKGNIDVFCHRLNIPVYTRINDAITDLRGRLK